MNDIKFYPRFYRCSYNKSDRGWIFSRLVMIPNERHKEVSDKYEDIFLSDPLPGGTGRDAANTYLNNVAKEYKLGK